MKPADSGASSISTLMAKMFVSGEFADESKGRSGNRYRACDLRRVSRSAGQWVTGQMQWTWDKGQLTYDS